MSPAKTLPRSAADYLPAKRSLTALKEAARGCEGCDLFRAATQTVFGEGSARARVMLVGEQPGDVEDQQGHPFVGPAGKVLDRALSEAGLDRKDAYVTNAVKHFSFEARGKARLHKRPKAGEVRACVPWLHAEIELVEPAVLVLLGATAGQAIFGPSFRLLKERGRPLESELAPLVVATVHPSAVLRARDSHSRAETYGLLLQDLRFVVEHLERAGSPRDPPRSANRVAAPGVAARLRRAKANH